MTLNFDSIPDLCSRTDLSKILNLHRQTIARAEGEGKLLGIHLNQRVVVYTKEAILRWLLDVPEPEQPTTTTTL
jgi:hypothetical protein